MPCETGKAVFVEKPLALTREELDRIVEVVASTGNDRLMVGFNRRFAPLLDQLKSQFGPACSSAVTRYLVSAGPLAADSWYRNDALEGSRFTGEGGHFIDTLSWWAGSLPEEVYAVPGPEKDDVQVTVRFANGSSGVITYVTGGNTRFPKETFDAAGGGRSARLDNFRKATVWTGRGHSTMRARGGQDKGQRAELGLRRGLPDRRGDADPAGVPGGRHQGDDRGGREPVEREAGAGMSAASALTARLVRAPGGRDVAGRGGLARARSGAAGGVVAAAGDAGTTRRGCRRRQRVSAQFAAVLPPDAAARVPEEARAAVLAAPTSCCAANGKSWASSGPTWCSPTGSATR